MYASHLDAHIYAYYSQQVIEPLYESLLKENTEIDQSVIAYRSIPIAEGEKGSKNNIHFAKDVFDEVRRRENCVAILYDIENFFPTLDHKKLKLAWANALGKKSLPKDHYNLFKSVTKFSFVNLNDLKKDDRSFDEKRLDDIRKSGKHSYLFTVKEFLETNISIYKNPEKAKGILKKIESYRISTIASAAVLEGGNLIAVIAVLLTGDYFFFLFFALGMIAFLMIRPSEKGLIKYGELSKEEAQQLLA